MFHLLSLTVVLRQTGLQMAGIKVWIVPFIIFPVNVFVCFVSDVYCVVQTRE